MPLINYYTGLDLRLIERIQKVLAAMAALGFPMKLTSGLRTLEQQQKLYAQGRTAPGRIVTYADGITNKSNHQGGRAVDCCFQGPEPYSERHPWKVFGVCVEAVGLKWGGRFTRPDRPHAELPKE